MNFVFISRQNFEPMSYPTWYYVKQLRFDAMTNIYKMKLGEIKIKFRKLLYLKNKYFVEDLNTKGTIFH